MSAQQKIDKARSHLSIIKDNAEVAAKSSQTGISAIGNIFLELTKLGEWLIEEIEKEAGDGQA